MLDTQLFDFLLATCEDLDPVFLFERVIGAPDPWQSELLHAEDEFILVLASRQVGKSTTIACIVWSLLAKGKFIVLCAPSQRQAAELYKKVMGFRNRSHIMSIRSTQTELELSNGGRLVCAPSSSDTIRGYSAVDLICLDEAAFADDETITALMPMRAENGKIFMSTTPNGARGFFYEVWKEGKVRRINARSVEIPRLARKVAFDKAHLPSVKFEVEHLCSFIGSGRPYFNPVAIEAALSQEVVPLWN
jgi:Terminase large subunit, T4likevirus-type, N-terminal